MIAATARYGRSFRAVAIFLFSFVTWTTPSQADEPRDVLLVGGGVSFREAVRNALASWNLRVVAIDSASPSPTMPRAAGEARALTHRHSASGLVWIVSSGDEHALFVYDLETDQLVSRTMAKGPPFDGPAAAAAALSVKTLLRSSTVAPSIERIGAERAATPREPEIQSPAEAVSDSRHASDPFAPAIEVVANARAIGGALDTRVGLGASAFFGPTRRWGVGLVGRLGPGLDIDRTTFRGRFDEASLSSSLRVRLPLRPVFVEPRAGTTLHATRIEGVVVSPARAARESRLDASVDVGLVVDVPITQSMRVGVDFETSYVLRYQRYLVQNEIALELRPLQASLGLRFSLGLL